MDSDLVGTMDNDNEEEVNTKKKVKVNITETGPEKKGDINWLELLFP